MNSAKVEQISECFIKPKYDVQESKQPFYLAPCDLALLSFHYIQKGLLFTKPSHYNDQEFSIITFLNSLKDSLSLALVHFYPLAGQLVVETSTERHESLVFIDCDKGPGARFIHAELEMTVSDILSPDCVPEVVHSFFDHTRAVNYDGHTRPLISVQVTELIDGVFIGCSMNHAVVDGTSYWQFWNVWSEIHRAKGKDVPALRFPVNKRWFPDGHGPEIFLPFVQPDEFIQRYESVPQLRERFFHLSSQAVARLKTKANQECSSSQVSSFQALAALVWRAVERATCRPHEELTDCKLAASNRLRLGPNFLQDYFGNCVSIINTSITVGELLGNSLGWVALRLNQLVRNFSDTDVYDGLEKWLQSPATYKLTMFDTPNVTVSSSPRFDMYGNEFGLGKAVAVRSGYANKFVGSVTTYPGHDGEGSVDLEICLLPDSMSALVSDMEFMNYAQ